MKGSLEMLIDYLSEYLLDIDPERIREGIKNPAKYPWIITELNEILQIISQRVKNSQDTHLVKIREIIKEELMNALLICQDSKCEPLKFVNFKSK